MVVTDVMFKGQTYKLIGLCPFCGQRKFMINWGYASHVFCTKCGMAGPKGITPEEAVEKWNEAMA